MSQNSETSSKSEDREKIIKDLFRKDPHLRKLAKRIFRNEDFQTKCMVAIDEENKAPESTDSTSEASPSYADINIDQDYLPMGATEDSLGDEVDIEALEQELASAKKKLQTGQLPAMEPEEKEEVEWVIHELSRSVASVSDNEFGDFIASLTENTDPFASLQLPELVTQEDEVAGNDTTDIDDYAIQIGVSPKDLIEAMKEEEIPSLDSLYQSFCEMASDNTLMGMQNFDIFVQSLVASHLDRKKEDQLMGLIGVSSDSGRQSLATTYSRLLAEIFRVEMGGFFLANSQNPNYNCFNVGNVIQTHLLELDEMKRVSYLENLLALLYLRDELGEAAVPLAEKNRSALFMSRIKDKDIAIRRLAKYMADLAIFRLGYFPPDLLPEELEELIPQTVYEILPYVKDFPSHITRSNNRIAYMMERLVQDNPIVFVIE